MILFHNPDEEREDVRDSEDALAEPGEAIPAEALWAELDLERDNRSEAPDSVDATGTAGHPSM